MWCHYLIANPRCHILLGTEARLYIVDVTWSLIDVALS